MTRRIFNERSIYNERTEKLKIIFQFLTTAIISFVLGSLLLGACSDSFEAFAQNKLNAHLSCLFYGIGDFKDAFMTIVMYTLPYIFSVIVIAFLSFSVLSNLASDIVILSCGIKIGFSITLFLNCLTYGSDLQNVNLLKFLIFAVFRVFILALIIWYAYKAALFSKNISCRNSSGRFYLEPSRILSFMAITMTNIGALIFINGVYCAIAFVLK